mgnify:CR=1 FL=1
MNNVQTLCWSCANAVPSADGERGCPWSLEGKPVEGWSARRRDIQLQSPKKKDKARSVESYLVVACPLYRPG